MIAIMVEVNVLGVVVFVGVLFGVVDSEAECGWRLGGRRADGSVSGHRSRVREWRERWKRRRIQSLLLLFLAFVYDGLPAFVVSGGRRRLL